MSDVHNILFDGEELSDEQLINYLKGNLSDEELHNVEKQMADSSFVNDAVEGLQNFSSDKKLDAYVKQLNDNLHQQLTNKKQLKEQRNFKDLQWYVLAVVLILILCLLSYVIVMMVKRREQQKRQVQQTTDVRAHRPSANNNFYQV